MRQCEALPSCFKECVWEENHHEDVGGWVNRFKCVLGLFSSHWKDHKNKKKVTNVLWIFYELQEKKNKIVPKWKQSLNFLCFSIFLSSFLRKTGVFVNMVTEGVGGKMLKMQMKQDPHTVWTTGSRLGSDRSSSSRGCGVRLSACRSSPPWSEIFKTLMSGEFFQNAHISWTPTYENGSCSQSFGPQIMNERQLTDVNELHLGRQEENVTPAETRLGLRNISLNASKSCDSGDTVVQRRKWRAQKGVMQEHYFAKVNIRTERRLITHVTNTTLPKWLFEFNKTYRVFI